MKNVTLKKMSFTFFKSFKGYTIDFSERTNISGANGQGKTTIFDGFTWVLFGKDSQDRAEFDIKTKDADGVVITRVPHEVTAVLDVNGEEITLTRCLKEVWRRDKDSNGEEVFKGNETERLYNGVPCSVKNWQEKIDAIIKEAIFKYATNPHYFAAQKADVQRALLFKMAGGVTDAEIIDSNDEFRKLFAQAGNKSLVEFEEETKASLARVRKELSDLPARIDERKRYEIAAEDWESLEQQVADHTKELQEVDDAIADRAKAITAASEARVEIARKVAEAKRQQRNRHDAVINEASEKRRQLSNKHTELSNEVKRAESERDRLCDEVSMKESVVSRYNDEINTLRNDYHNINAEQLTFSDADFTCPTCGRAYEVFDIESKKSEMTERFNADKARRLEENKQNGLKLKSKIEDNKQKIEEHKARIEELTEHVINKEKEASEVLNEMNAINIDNAYAADTEYQSLSAQVQELEAQLASAPTVIADSDLQTKKRTISAELDALKARLNKREQILKNEERIHGLEKQNSKLGEEEVRLKGILYRIKEFSKARSHAISDRVNGLFKYVRFKLFDTQVNGDVVEVCEATMNGVPYSVLSNGEKIVAGLDIIRTIQRHVGVSAPIFIDNAEAISGYPDGLLEEFEQMVFMRVTEDEKLTVKYE